jgi:phage shock protein PspC (stress-responsive transcriptional regulator)
MFDDVVRSQENRVVAGVCGGLAAHWQVPAWVVRLVFVLMFIPGVPLYLLLWLTTPRSPRRGLA